MGTTANYGLRYPELADPPVVHNDLANLANDVDAKIPGVPIGASSEWDYGAAQIPSWALLQYGQAISRTTYATLAALAAGASYPHGSGDGSTTFNLADKRGRASAGKDDMGGTAANRITAAISGTAGTVLGAAVGGEGVTLATAQIPSHSHGSLGTGYANTGTESADHAHSTGTGTVSANHYHEMEANTGQGNDGQWWVDRLPDWTNNADSQNTTDWISADHSHSAWSGGRNTAHNHGDYGHGHTSSNDGGGGTHLNVQPTIICNKIVRAL